MLAVRRPDRITGSVELRLQLPRRTALGWDNERLGRRCAALAYGVRNLITGRRIAGVAALACDLARLSSEN